MLHSPYLCVFVLFIYSSWRNKSKLLLKWNWPKFSISYKDLQQQNWFARDRVLDFTPFKNELNDFLLKGCISRFLDNVRQKSIIIPNLTYSPSHFMLLVGQCLHVQTVFCEKITFKLASPNPLSEQRRGSLSERKKQYLVKSIQLKNSAGNSYQELILKSLLDNYFILGRKL